jgi:hypothetical protein
VAGGLVSGPEEEQAGARRDDAVQGQLEAYNAGDVEAFLACYTEDAVLRDAAGGIRMRGREQMRERYSRRLAPPGPHATIVQRLVCGDWTVDHEHVTGFDGGDGEFLVAYRTGSDGRIEEVVFLR